MNKTKQIPFKQFQEICKYNDKGYCVHCIQNDKGVVQSTNYSKELNGYLKCKFQRCPFSYRKGEYS